MSSPRRLLTALLWNALAYLIGAAAMIGAALIAVALILVRAVSPDLSSFVLLMAPLMLAGVVVATALYQHFLRRFYAQRLGIAIGLGEALAVIIITWLASGAVGALIESLATEAAGQAVSLLLALIVVPLWFTRGGRGHDSVRTDA